MQLLSKPGTTFYFALNCPLESGPEFTLRLAHLLYLAQDEPNFCPSLVGSFVTVRYNASLNLSLAGLSSTLSQDPLIQITRHTHTRQTEYSLLVSKRGPLMTVAPLPLTSAIRALVASQKIRGHTPSVISYRSDSASDWPRLPAVVC